jgi:hypothetical protein
MRATCLVHVILLDLVTFNSTEEGMRITEFLGQDNAAVKYQEYVVL